MEHGCISSDRQPHVDDEPHLGPDAVIRTLGIPELMTGGREQWNSIDTRTPRIQDIMEGEKRAVG